MSVQILAIKFNHDHNSFTADALSIRRNASTTVNVPEWRRGISVTPEDSPAAYSIADTQGQTITIQANFRRANPSVATAEVRAIDPNANPQPGGCGCGAWLSWLIAQIVKSLTGNVLGAPAARSVTFQPNDETGFVSFNLNNVQIWSVGVGARTTEWKWQYRLNPSDPWIDMDTTSHRIYTVLTTPTAPWNQTPGNIHLPWTDALDYACKWALIAKTADEAGLKVTQAVYDLGPAIVTYDCPGGGSTHYAWPVFNLTAFIDRLKGGVGLGQYINCSDCATITSTFANLVGCDLWQSRMSPSGGGAWSFALNEILAIGSNTWQTACGWGGFSYHEVAWKGACDATEPVWDACLQVDGDADPTTAPHTAELPANMRFGNPGDGDYRDKLCTVAGRPDCDPQPGTRQRRSLA